MMLNALMKRSLRRLLCIGHRSSPSTRLPSLKHLHLRPIPFLQRQQRFKSLHHAATRKQSYTYSASLFAFFSVSFVACSSYPRNRRLLEGEGGISETYLTQEQYVPVTEPLSIEQAEDMLRWDEDSQILPPGSSILRYDFVQIASNLPLEDGSNFSKVFNNDELRYAIFSVFDGHACVFL